MIRENFEKNMLELQNKMVEMVDLTVIAMEKSFTAARGLLTKWLLSHS